MCVSVNAGDIFAGAQLMYVAAFSYKKGALDWTRSCQSLTTTPLPEEG